MRRFAVPALLALLAVSCGKPEEVRRYTAPKDPQWRMLAAIVPTKSDTWFFKLVGASNRLAAVRDEYTAFIKSLQITEKVTWTLPAGWSAVPGSGDRKSTLRFGREEPLLEVSVTSFPGDAGGGLPNVNRWRNQMGLAPVTDLSGIPTAEVSGTTVTLVDLEGSKLPAGPPQGMPGGKPEPRESRRDLRSMFTYTVPAGWTENPSPENDRILEFRSGDLLVTLTAFAGQTGDLAQNVNRWRQQAGLEPLSTERAEASARSMVFVDKDGYYVEVLGSARGIVCAFILERTGSMFLKMDGPAELVDRQKPAFHSFIQTLKVNRHG